MDVKFSQLPFLTNLKDEDYFPTLSDGDNYITPMYTVRNYLSGDKLIQVYSSYASNSSYLIDSAKLANSVYTQYFVNSSFYVLKTDFEYSNWNSNYNTTRSLSGGWNSSKNFVNSVSSVLMYSNSTLVPNSSAIKNVVAITQANYNLLTYIDPETFYVIASV
jgi:hypothetical protein